MNLLCFDNLFVSIPSYTEEFGKQVRGLVSVKECVYKSYA